MSHHVWFRKWQISEGQHECLWLWGQSALTPAGPVPTRTSCLKVDLRLAGIFSSEKKSRRKTAPLADFELASFVVDARILQRSCRDLSPREDNDLLRDLVGQKHHRRRLYLSASVNHQFQERINLLADAHNKPHRWSNGRFWPKSSGED